MEPPRGTKRPWLGTADAATKRARKAPRKQEQNERLVDDRTVFEIKKRLAGILDPGETVPGALKRLKSSGSGVGGGGAGCGSGRMDEASWRAFDEVTDAAAELVARGDLGAYSDDREAFESAAWVYEYRRRARASASAAPPEVQEQHEADDRTVDMFGDGVHAGARTATDVGAGGQAGNPDQPAAAVEKGAEREGTGVAGSSDYVYHPASGYYYSGSTGYYYDAASGCYCSAYTGTWFSYGYNDEAQPQC